LLEQIATRTGASDFVYQIEQATQSLQAERQNGNIAGGKITGGLVEIHNLQNLAIISDLHGDSKSLFNILCEINYEQFLANPYNKIVFLGDYIDRGSDSIGILYSICYLKHVYPDSIILMRGNHEAPIEFPFVSHDLPYRIADRFGSRSKTIYSKLLSMFKMLTLSIIIDQRLLLVHGGLPTQDESIENYKKSIATAHENNVKSRVLEELLWNDPREIHNPLGWEASNRGFGRHFGEIVTRKWLKATGTKVIVRGHEPCPGYRIDHNGMILTLFSCKEPYPLFNTAFVLLSMDQLCRINNARQLSLCVRFPAWP